MSLEIFIKVMDEIMNDYDEIVKVHHNLIILKAINDANNKVEEKKTQLISQNKIYNIRCMFILLYNDVVNAPNKLNKYVDFLRGGFEMLSGLMEYSEKIDKEFDILVKNLLSKVKKYIGYNKE